jgi:hypothetical protein
MKEKQPSVPASQQQQFQAAMPSSFLSNYQPQVVAYGLHIAQLHAYSAMANGSNVVQRQPSPHGGLPEQLQTGIESLSGIAMDDVRVHYHSSKPAQLQAHAYAQGTEIHLAPGQERHLPHEAWHVVQQKQGRVKPTLQLKGVAINDDSALEREADQMGEKAMGITSFSSMAGMDAHIQKKSALAQSLPTQRVVQRVKSDPAYNTLTLKQKLEQFYDYTYLYMFNPRPALLKTLDTEIAALDKNNLAANLLMDYQARALHDVWLLLSDFCNSDDPGENQNKINRHANVELLRDELQTLIETNNAWQQGQIDLLSNTARGQNVGTMSRQGYKKYVNQLEERSGNKAMAGFHGDCQAGIQAQQHSVGFENLAEHQRALIMFIIGQGYGLVNEVLRSGTTAVADQDLILKAKEIVTALGSMTARAGEEERYSTHFPGGQTNPADLEVDKVYADRGFFFVGEERPSDAGFCMYIQFNRGYFLSAEIARQFYGQDKSQYILLPNTQLRYLGEVKEFRKTRYRFQEV